MTSSASTVPAVTNCYTLQTKLLLKSDDQKQNSAIKNGGKSWTEASQNSSHEQTCFLLKKPVESQYSFSSCKKDTHVYKDCYELRSRVINNLNWATERRCKIKKEWNK